MNFFIEQLGINYKEYKKGRIEIFPIVSLRLLLMNITNLKINRN